MQEIKKRRILLASVLKPVDEPRMCERMGQSLAKHGFEVFIAGFPSSSNISIEGVTFLPLQKFKRISVGRIKARFEILLTALSIKPDVLIVTTHELLGAAILFKLFTSKKIIYDVQEDYWQNIIHTNAWPKLISPLIAFSVRLKEWLVSPFFSKFFLAEKCYEQELRFTRGKSVVIENKCLLPASFQYKTSNEIIQLIFTGTIAASTGIFEAISLSKKLYQLDQRIRLTIIGQCFQSKTLQKIEAEIAGNSFIQLIGGNEFVSHVKILDAISSANFGIVSYPDSVHTKSKIPSKLYEYLSGQLPILLSKNKTWNALCAPSNAAIVIDFKNPDANRILQLMRENSFYLKRPENTSWESEEDSLLTIISSVF
jgi:hypothetical protein